MSKTAAVPEAPIVVAFPTINSGLVLRWYASERAYVRGPQLANAGREETWLLSGDDAPADLREVVQRVHERIRDEVYGRPFGLIDNAAYAAVTALATHRPAHFLSDELVPIAAAVTR